MAELLDYLSTPLTRRTVSPQLILSPKNQVQSDVIDFILNEPHPLPAEAVPVDNRSGDRWWGILGLLGVGVILGLSLYSIVRYLL